MNRSIRSLGLGIVVLAALSSIGRAATVNWTNSAGGTYSTLGNWSAGGPPGSLDMANFGLAAAYGVSLDVSPSNNRLTVSAGSVTLLNSTAGRTYTVSDSVIASGGQLILNSPASVAINAAGGQAVNGGQMYILAGNDVNTSAFVVGGSGAGGTVTIDGSGSTLAATSFLAANSGAATLNFQNNASGNIGQLQLGTGSSGEAVMSIKSGADVVATDYARIGSLGSGAASGILNVDGTGSTYSTGPAPIFRLGATTGGSGTVNVTNGGSMTLGLIEVNNTGTFNVSSGGTVNTSTWVQISKDAGAGTQGNIIVSGAGSVFTQTGGALTVGNATSGGGTLQIDAGGAYTSTAGGEHVVHPTGLIDINGVGSNFNVGGRLIVNGGTFDNANGGTFNLAPGKEFIVQNGGDAVMGDYLLPASASPSIPTLKIISGGTYTGGALHIGNGNNAQATVNDAGSNLTAQLTIVGGNGGVGALTIGNNATASLGVVGVVSVNANAGSVGVLAVQGGADVTADSVSLGTLGGPTGTSATLNVDGAGTTFTQAGASTLSVGGFNGTTGGINLTNDANYETGSGLTTVYQLGTITVDTGPASFGTFRINGDVTVDGGIIRRTSGFLSWASGKTMNIQNGGDVLLGTQGSQLSGNTINITGAGSTLVAGGIGLTNGSHLNINSGGRYTANSIGIGSEGSLDTATIDGSGSTLSVSGAGAAFVGSNGPGVLTFRNNATGALGFVELASDLAFAGGEGTLHVQSGADVTGSFLLKMASSGVGVATLDVSGAGSTFSLTNGSAAAIHVIGAASGGSATVNVSGGGSFTTASGSTTTLNATAVINITDGAVTLGNLVVNGGAINFNSGSLSYRGHLTVGSGGLLGPNLTLSGNKSLSLSRTTTIDSGRTLTLSGGLLSTASLIVNGAFNFSSGTLATDSIVNNGALMANNSAIDAPVVNNNAVTVVGSVDFNGLTSGPGDFFGSGTARFNGGLDPGASPAEVSFEGNVVFGNANTLLIELGGTTPGSQFDHVDVAGQLSLGGALAVSLIDVGAGLFAPEAGDSFDILDWGSVSGTFASINLPELAGLAWDTSQLYSMGVLAVVATEFLEADFDEDGDVDGDDLADWRVGFGKEGTAVHMDGDADGDLDVDGSDFLVWQRQLGSVSIVAAVESVPEPGALALVSLAGCSFALRRPRRR